MAILPGTPPPELPKADGLHVKLARSLGHAARDSGLASNQPATMKTCPTCHTQLDEGARTCPKCGKSFTTVGGVFVAVIIGLILGGWFFMTRR